MDQVRRIPEGSGEKARFGWIRQGEIRMDQAGWDPPWISD